MEKKYDVVNLKCIKCFGLVLTYLDWFITICDWKVVTLSCVMGWFPLDDDFSPTEVFSPEMLVVGSSKAFYEGRWFCPSERTSWGTHYHTSPRWWLHSCWRRTIAPPVPITRIGEKDEMDVCRYLEEVLEVSIGVLMWLPMEWICLHHIDKHRLKLKSRIPK